MSNFNNNCFLFLGKTGVGKSLCTKLLTLNKSIKVSDSKFSVTTKVTDYNAKIPSSLFSKEFNYKIIDTPGLNDSYGKDKENMNNLKSFLTDKSIKVKGVFIFLNFQDVRFDDAEKEIIKKIYKLIPINTFWEYITIVFTHFYGDRRISAEKKKMNTEESLRKSFEDLINDSYKNEAIIPINPKDLRIEYIDVYDPDIDENPEKTREENNKDLDKIKKIFKELSKKEPLYSEIKEKIIENEKVIEFIPNSPSNLYICKIKKYLYYNQSGKIIKEKGIILEKKFDKIIEFSEFSSTFNSLGTTFGSIVLSVGCAVGAACFPASAPALLLARGVFQASGVSSLIYGVTNFFIDKKKMKIILIKFYLVKIFLNMKNNYNSKSLFNFYEIIIIIFNIN